MSETFTPFNDYFPLGFHNEMSGSDKLAIVEVGGDILLLLMHTKGQPSFSETEARELSLGLDRLFELNFVLINNGVVYWNQANPMFSYILCGNDRFEELSPPSKKPKPTKYKRKGHPVDRADFNDNVERVITVISDNRERVGLKRLNYSHGLIDILIEKIESYGLEDVLLVIPGYFDWILENKEITDKKKVAKTSSIFTNMEVKLQISKTNKPDWRDSREVVIPESDDPLSVFYKIIAENWKLIIEKKVKIYFSGTERQKQIAALTFRIFRKTLGAETPATFGSPLDEWRKSWNKSISRDGLRSTSSDDLEINGSLYSVKSLEVVVPDILWFRKK
jgi:hypothetical protein